MKLTLVYIFLISHTYVLAQNIEFQTNERFVLGGPNDKTASIGVGDIDNDGDIDAVVANGRHWPEQNRVFYNNGFGMFTVSRPLDDISETSYATELADFDGDGDLDVAVGNDMAPSAIYINDGNGIFKRGANFGKTYSPTRNLTTADIDKDGDIDIIITNI